MAFLATDSAGGPYTFEWDCPGKGSEGCPEIKGLHRSLHKMDELSGDCQSNALAQLVLNEQNSGSN